MPLQRYLRKIILLALSSFILIPLAGAQNYEAVRDIRPHLDERVAKYRDSFAMNKTVPEEYEKQAWYALSLFPELKKAKIKIILRTGKKGIISTRPTVGSIFRRSSRRTYKVFIEEPATEGERRYSYHYADVNGQTGILGHELCHILYFNRHSGFGLLRLAIGHISRKYMDRFEYNTDSVAVERGLGYQLIAWNQFLRHAFGRPAADDASDPFFMSTGRERYMTISSIRRVINRSPMYESIR